MWKSKLFWGKVATKASGNLKSTALMKEYKIRENQKYGEVKYNEWSKIFKRWSKI